MSATAPRRLVAVGACLLALLAVTGCSEDEPDPVAERLDRLQGRLEQTFSRDQASCIVGELEPAEVQRLLASTDLPTDDGAFAAYSAAVRSCVVGAPTTTAAATTTTGASTDGGSAGTDEAGG